MKRVLVLAGGGAKGAFAFGCLKAFRDKKITFDAVSGASVGALNAIIWSTGQFEAGEDLWKKLSFETILPMTILDPKRHAKCTLAAFASMYVTLRLFWASLHGFPTPGRRIWLSLGATIAAIPMLLFSLAADKGSHKLEFATGMFLFWLAFSYKCLASGTAKGRVIFGAACVLPPWSFFLGLGVLVPFYGLDLKGTSGTQAVIAFFGGFAVLWGVYYVASKIFDPKVAVFSQSRLTAKIAEVLNSTLQVPTVVALACQEDVFDPDEPKWTTEHVHGNGAPSRYAEWYPDLRRVWVSHYYELNALDRSAATQICLASAALPFGLLPPINIQGTRYVDGGIIDNVPSFPFISAGNCDELFVVFLEPVRSKNVLMRLAGIDRKSFSMRDREARVALFPIPARGTIDRIRYWDRAWPPQTIPFREPAHIPRLVCVSPKRSLGNFLSGTMNFNGDYATRLMRRGYICATRVLETLNESDRMSE